MLSFTVERDIMPKRKRCGCKLSYLVHWAIFQSIYLEWWQSSFNKAVKYECWRFGSFNQNISIKFSGFIFVIQEIYTRRISAMLGKKKHSDCKHVPFQIETLFCVFTMQTTVFHLLLFAKLNNFIFPRYELVFFALTHSVDNENGNLICIYNISRIQT